MLYDYKMGILQIVKNLIKNLRCKCRCKCMSDFDIEVSIHAVSIKRKPSVEPCSTNSNTNSNINVNNVVLAPPVANRSLPALPEHVEHEYVAVV
jgi:hypothetical protein